MEIDGQPVRELTCFAQSWHARHGLDATWCAIIRVRGKSMELTLPDGHSILCDRYRRPRRNRQIYVVHTVGRLIVKRVANCREHWEFVTDNPAVTPEPWPAEAETIGEVVWVARTHIEPRSA